MIPPLVILVVLLVDQITNHLINVVIPRLMYAYYVVFTVVGELE